MAGDLPALESLCAAGANPNRKDANGDTPLLKACSGGGFTWHQTEAVETLIHAGADIEATDASGGTALVRAIGAGKGFAVIRVLLEAGAIPPATIPPNASPSVRAILRVQPTQHAPSIAISVVPEDPPPRMSESSVVPISRSPSDLDVMAGGVILGHSLGRRDVAAGSGEEECTPGTPLRPDGGTHWAAHQADVPSPRLGNPSIITIYGQEVPSPRLGMAMHRMGSNRSSNSDFLANAGELVPGLSSSVPASFGAGTSGLGGPIGSAGPGGGGWTGAFHDTPNPSLRWSAPASNEGGPMPVGGVKGAQELRPLRGCYNPFGGQSGP